MEAGLGERPRNPQKGSIRSLGSEVGREQAAPGASGQDLSMLDLGDLRESGWGE